MSLATFFRLSHGQGRTELRATVLILARSAPLALDVSFVSNRRVSCSFGSSEPGQERPTRRR